MNAEQFDQGGELNCYHAAHLSITYLSLGESGLDECAMDFFSYVQSW